MLFIRRHSRQSTGPEPGPEEYAIYDTTTLSQYVAYDMEGDEYDRTIDIMGDNYHTLCSYIPQYFTGTDDVNRQFVSDAYDYNGYEGWSLIEICFAPYSAFNVDYSSYNGGYIHFKSNYANGELGLGYNENSDTIMIGIGYTNDPDHYDETQGYIKVHYDGTRVLMTLFLVFINGHMRLYWATDDGFDEYDYPGSFSRLISSEIAYEGEYELYSNDSSITDNIVEEITPHIGDYKEFIGHNSDARIYSVRTFKGMGTLSDNVLDNMFIQHFEVDKFLFLDDAMAEYGGNN